MNILERIEFYLNEKSAYDKYFEEMLKKWKIKSPSELDKKQKIAFFDEVDKGWKADKETD